MKTYLYIWCLLVTALSYAQQTPAGEATKSYTIMNGTAHLGNGTKINNAIITIEKGVITNVVNAETSKIKPIGEVIDASGQHVYPGIIACNTTLGLVEIDAVKASDDDREIGTYNPHIRSIIAYNAESRVVETMRPNGVLMAQIVPRGGRISGKSSVVQLDAWNWEDAIIKEDGGIHINWPSSFSRTGSWYNPGPIEPNKRYQSQVKELEEFMVRAKKHDESMQSDLKFESLQDVFKGTITAYIHVNGEKSIRDVLAFKTKLNIPIVLVGARGAQNLTKELVAMNIPVLAGRVHDLPARDDEDYDMPYKFPAILMNAGVTVALENSGDMERHQARNFPFYAGTTRAHGLTNEQALQIVTLNAAKILGIDKDYGSLEQGKKATLFISTGDALDMRTNKLTRAFIDGRDISLSTRQYELYERYMNKYKN